MSYEDFAPLAKLLLGVNVPKGTYDSQRTYLQHRTPEEMGDNEPSPIGDL